MANSVSGYGWQFIRLGGNTKYDMARKLSTVVTRLPEEILTRYYYREVQKIAFRARRIMLETIEEAETVTGKRRASKGGKGPGRRDTDRMYKSVWARVYRTGNGSLAAQVGWLEGRPGYAIFQEYGTRNGVVGMRALQKAGDYIEQEMDKLGRGGKRYRRNNEWDWNAPAGNGTDLGGAPDWYVK